MAALPKKSSLPSNVTMGIHEGTLNLFRKGALRKVKKYYATLVAASQSGLARLELYEDEKHSLSMEPTFMVLGIDVVKVERIMLKEKEMRNAFLIGTKDQYYTFFVQTSGECDKWVTYIQNTLLRNVEPSGNTLLADKTVSMTVNEIYESVGNISPQKNEFLVKSDENTKTRLGVFGDIKMIVEDESISLMTPACKMIVRWNFKEIRKFTVTKKVFSLEVGRKSAVGEGTFIFITEEGDAISRIININKKAMKEKIERTRNLSKPVTSPPPVQSHAFPQSSFQHAPKAENINTCSDAIYSSYESLMMVPHSAKPRSPTANVCHQKMLLPNQDSHYSTGKPVTPTRIGLSSSTNQGINSSAENDTQEIVDQHGIDQGQIYSEPKLIINAWQSHGYNDDVEDSRVYSSLEFSQKQKEAESKNHYWVGETNFPGDVKKEKQDKVMEDIYAVVDYSMKQRNKK